MTASGLLNAFFDLVNSLVEIYLANVISPFLVLHEKLYSSKLFFASNSTTSGVFEAA